MTTAAPGNGKGPQDAAPGTDDPQSRYVSRVRRAYLAVSGFDYFADMLLTVTSVLLLQSYGMSSSAVFALVAAVWIVEGICEIPTGILADMVGRRASVALSFVLRAVGYGALFFSDNVTVAAAGTLLAAIGGTFSSGALEAWAVDETGARDSRELDRLFARGKIAENSGLVLGTLAGAALGSLDLAWPQLAAGAACALSAVLALSLMGGGPHSPRSPHAFLRGLRASGRDVVTGARLTLRGDRVLIVLIVGTAFLWMFRGVPGVQWTVVYESLAGGHLLVLAVMRSVGSLLEIPLLGWIMALQQRRGTARRTVVVTASAVGAIALATAGVVRDPLVSMVCYVGFTTAFGLCMPGLRAAVNERIEAGHRATVLSMASLANSLLTGGGLILVGTFVDDLGSAGLSWPLAAAGFAAAGLLLAALTTRSVPGRPAEADGSPAGQPAPAGVQDASPA
ncbi:MFS transporter [Streptomyces pristinaespiralis]|uniref:MFS transporter n=1 Tax=Streptomyces pristinaespiralis TaxID=38300 RepID=UPI003836D518